MPPVFMSGNLDDGQKYNDKIFKQYKDGIKYTSYL